MDQVLLREGCLRRKSVLHYPEVFVQVALVGFFPFVILWIHKFDEKLPEEPVRCIGCRDWTFLLIHKRAVLVDSLPFPGFVAFPEKGFLIPPPVGVIYEVLALLRDGISFFSWDVFLAPFLHSSFEISKGLIDPSDHWYIVRLVYM